MSTFTVTESIHHGNFQYTLSATGDLNSAILAVVSVSPYLSDGGKDNVRQSLKAHAAFLKSGGMRNGRQETSVTYSLGWGDYTIEIH